MRIAASPRPEADGGHRADTGTPAASRIYVGRLVHRRQAVRAHRFSYPLYMHLFDLDELPELSRRLRLFALNRWAPVSFHDADHLGPRGRPTRENVVDFIRRQGGQPPGGRILLLTHPRLFGYVFNPVSFYYCLDPEGRLGCVVAEVNNTFGERHTYLLDERTPPAAGARRRAGRGGKAYSAPKMLYVSPFIGPESRFDFYFTPPGRALSVHMDDVGPGGLILDATFAAEARPMTDREMLKLLVAYPFMTLRVIARIHWQALCLWWKRVPHQAHVARPARETP